MRMLRFHLSLMCLAVTFVPVLTVAAAVAAPPGKTSDPCRLGGGIERVIYIQFDNTHFTRDNPNVPSDLEQIPNLLNFMTDNGSLLSRHYTALISHTATGILTSLTGVYGDRMGQPVSNSFRYLHPHGPPKTGSDLREV